MCLCINLYQSFKGKARAIVKKKISKFSEVKKYNEAEKWTQKGCSPFAASCTKREVLEYEMYALITENRLNNVLSKTGKVNFEEKEQVMMLLRELVGDVVESLKEDFEAEWLGLAEGERSELMKQIRMEAKKLIECYYKEHVFNKNKNSKKA